MKVPKDHSDNPTLIDPQTRPTRIGAFEVQLFSKNEGRFLEKILHTKLKTGMWPSVSMILEKIHFFLPRVPKVVVQLFKDNHAHQVRQKDFKEQEESDEFKDFQVSIKSLYTATSSQQQLSEFLFHTEQERLAQMLIARQKRQMMQSKTSRPISAKTQIGGNDPLQ